MVVEPILNNKIKIRLSNTESITQNIYKYTTLEEIKETKSTSSTCNYFLTTKREFGNQLLSKFNNSGKLFFCDVKKTLQCFEKQNRIIKERKIEDKFRGNLVPFYESLDLFRQLTINQLNIGYSSAKFDSNERYNLYFDSNNRNTIIFKNGIIAVLCDLIIEEYDSYFIIYPVIKEELTTNVKEEMKNNLNTYIHNMDLENIEETKEYLKQIIQESYKLLTYMENEK